MKAMTAKEFAEKVVEKFCIELTDQLFLYIENDKELMQDYLRVITEEGLHKTNQDLGADFKELFFVDNLGETDKVKSKLIKTYTQHTMPDINIVKKKLSK
ncbi:MAG: hypothetical protein LBQ22_00945 [Bacteroidales bacterium]|jgi:hypothetical protein|nr:hypothetical protein [Bacteroidales bacterium]